MEDLLYQALPHTHFRLLSFLDDDGLACSLATYRFDSAPAFVALSYTWKVPADKVKPGPYILTINGQHIEVQQNLHDAVRHLGREVRARGCMLWVDAVCINQSDLVERASQVRRMRWIYEGATHVFAWLGVADDDAEAKVAIEVIQRTMKTWPKEVDDPDHDALSNALANTPSAAPSEEPGDIEQALRTITSVFELPYFSRVWTCQEATTPCPITFWLGAHTFDDMFIEGYLGCAHRFTAKGDAALGFAASVINKSYLALIKTSRATRMQGLPRNLIDLLAEVRASYCIDPRDKVFATLAHADDIAGTGINVNYHRSLDDVYRGTTLWLLKQYGLNTFGLISAPSHDKAYISALAQGPQLATWIVDWRQRLMATALSGGNLYDPLPGSATYYEAHNDVLDDPDNGILELYGYVADSLNITILTDTWLDEDLSTETPKRWYAMSVNREDNPVFSPEVVDRVLVADKRRLGGGGEQITWRRSHRVQWDLLASSQFSFNAYVRRIRNNAFLDLFTACYARRLAILNGNRLALLPAAAEVGDRVAAFCGGRALYVRPAADNNEYGLVGECYVDGLMDGAFLKEAGMEGQMVQRIRLV